MVVGRSLIQVFILGAQTVGRAFTKAVREEMNAAKETARRQSSATKEQPESVRRAAATNARHKMSLQEACQILNVGHNLSSSEVVANYETMFKANDKSNGGSLYIQSKIYRAKERIDVELKSRDNVPEKEV